MAFDHDARVMIEMNQTLHLNSIEFADAIQLYQEHQAGIHREVEIIDESEDSGNSHQSRGSVFDRLGEKAKKKKQKESDTTKQRILAEKREQIRKEKEEKLEKRIAQPVQLEEEKLVSRSRSKRYRKKVSPELILDDENEGPEQSKMRDMIHELHRKMGNDSGLEIGGNPDPFQPFLGVYSQEEKHETLQLRVLRRTRRPRRALALI